MPIEIDPINVREEKPTSIFMFCKNCWDYKEFDSSNIDWNEKYQKVECKTCNNIQKVNLENTFEYYYNLNEENS